MKISNFLKFIPLLLLAVLMTVSCNNRAGNENQDTNDTMDLRREDNRTSNSGQEEHRQFAMEAASGGMLEIRLSEMAIDRARNQEVKTLAQTIRTDHESANKKLKQIIQVNDWNVPNDMMDKHQQKVRELQTTSAEEFDKQYLKMMVEDHEKDIAKFEEAANNMNPERGNNTRTTGENTQNRTGNAPGTNTGNTMDNNRETGQRSNTTADNRATGQNTDQTVATNRNNTMNNTGGGNQQLQSWINETLPVLRKHLERSRELQNRLQSS